MNQVENWVDIENNLSEMEKILEIQRNIWMRKPPSKTIKILGNWRCLMFSLKKYTAKRELKPFLETCVKWELKGDKLEKCFYRDKENYEKIKVLWDAILKVAAKMYNEFETKI